LYIHYTAEGLCRGMPSTKVQVLRGLENWWLERGFHNRKALDKVDITVFNGF
jgi:hypothetical protein